MSSENGDANGRLLGAVGALFGLGTLYSLLVGWLGREGVSEGYTAVLVVAGTAMVLAVAAPVVGARTVLRLLALFAAAGAPMTAGDMWRYAMRRRRAQEQLRRGY